jgi:membrane fusion protein (multidrug efflux system)
MLQRTKTADAAHLTVVPAGVAGEAEAEAPQPVSADAEARGAPQPVTQAEAPGKAPAAARKSSRKRILMGAAAIAVLIGGAWFGYHYATVGRFLVSTDDAYVRANNTTLGAKVSGYIAELPVEENTRVHAGDLVARIDDGDYRLAVDQARDKVATQSATISRFDRQIEAQRSAVAQAQAQLASAQAGRTRMQLEYERQQSLEGKQFASKQTLEQSIANRDQANASVLSAKAALDNAIANIGVLEAQKQEAVTTLAELRTALAKA